MIISLIFSCKIMNISIHLSLYVYIFLSYTSFIQPEHVFIFIFYKCYRIYVRKIILEKVINQKDLDRQIGFWMKFSKMVFHPSFSAAKLLNLFRVILLPFISRFNFPEALLRKENWKNRRGVKENTCRIKYWSTIKEKLVEKYSRTNVKQETKQNQ